MKALAVVWAVKYFHPYLYGHACTVSTNHEALKSLLNSSSFREDSTLGTGSPKVRSPDQILSRQKECQC